MHIRTAFFLIVLGIQGFVPDAGAAGSSPACTGERAGLQTRLEHVWTKQQRSGDIVLDGADSLFYHHPLLATFALEAFRESGDHAFLRKSHDTLKAYFNYLFLYHDSDRDFLVERPSTSAPNYPSDLEDVGFNTMLALDLLSFSRICVELGMPIDALYWYRGTKTISGRLVRASFDPEALLFLPTRATSPEKHDLLSGLSVLPAYFTTELGTEAPLRLLRAHVLAGDAAWADAPARYLSPGPGSGGCAEPSARRLRAVLLLGVLEWNGLAGEAAGLARDLASDFETRTTGTDAAEPLDDIGRYADCLIRSSGPFALFPRYQELACLDQLVFRKALLDPERTASFRKSIASIERYLLEDPARSGPAGVEAADSARAGSIVASVREVYFAISLLRDKWKQKALFSQSDLAEIPGFDLRAAAPDLWDDVVETLRRAETRATRDQWLAEGFELTATVEHPSVAPGEPATVIVRVSSATRDHAIRQIIAYHPQGTDTLWSGPSPLVVSPGAAPREFRCTCPVPRDRESPIVPIVCSAEARFDDGRRARYHFRMGVSIRRPVTCTVSLPKGSTLNDGTVPIEIVVEKRVPRGTSIQAQWYSPVGLKPAEGRSVEAWMPAETNEAKMMLNVPVPTPCRPGSFPFTLTVFANGDEIGRVSSALFRHYQWLFVGPFPGKRDAIEIAYAPESRTDPLDTYSAALGELEWRPLPPGAYDQDGRITLRELLPQGSVGFLYTVIEAAASRTSAVLFECDAPAALFVNGEPVARIESDGVLSSQRAQVPLRSGPNNVLVKTLSTGEPVVFFQLGDEEDLMSDEFNNNLWELVDGYEELVARRHTGQTAAERVQRQVTITYRDTRATSVSVVGSFNGWSPASSAMRKNKYGEWEINLYLSPGRYTYRLRVDDASEVLDPASPYTEPDGYGGQNSVLYVQ